MPKPSLLSLYWITLFLYPLPCATPVLHCQCDGSNFLLLKYWTPGSYKKANARCGIFCKAFGIISLSVKHLGLTFLFIDWRLFFCLPLLQKWGCVMLQEAVTWHLVLSRALSGENEKCDTWWRNLPQHIWVDKVKSRKDICSVDVLQLPLCIFMKNIV